MTEEKTAVGQGVAVGEAEGKRNEATEWRSGALVGSNPTPGAKPSLVRKQFMPIVGNKICGGNAQRCTRIGES
jgi:hypothetical protein